MPVTIDNVEYVTIREATVIAQRGSDAIRRWIREGSVIAHRDSSSRWLIQRSSLDAYLRGNPATT